MKRLFRRPGADASFAYWRKMVSAALTFLVLARVQVLHFHDLMHTQSMAGMCFHVVKQPDVDYMFLMLLAKGDQSEMTAKNWQLLYYFVENCAADLQSDRCADSNRFTIEKLRVKMIF